MSAPPLPPAPTEDPDLTGRQLGDYHLIRRLGRGGMAVVYLAEQESLSRKVAFKVLRSSLAENHAYVQRFLHEAKAAASLVHANIVQIHEIGCVDGIHFIAQEYVEGQNLKQSLARHGTLSVGHAVNVMRQVAAALHKAGQARITHRDIKPENILLSRTGEVKVADFGLARVEREGTSVNLTQVGVTMGTPLYMSPEQLEGRTVDTRSDLYSFGVTCYEMLAGRPPFTGDSPLNIAVQHLKKDPPRLEDVRPDLPGAVCRIVHRMMAKRPEDRYASAADLLKDLRRLKPEGAGAEWPTETQDWQTPELLAALSMPDTEGTQQLTAVMQREAAVRSGRGSLALVALAIVLSMIVGGVLAWARRPPPLLQVSPAELPPIEKQATVRDQYLYAMGIATEEAWQSVAKFFPPEADSQNRYYALRVTQRLAELYLSRDEWDRAMQAYEKLVNAGATESQFRAIGLAGQANIHVLRDEQSLASQKLAMLVRVIGDVPQELRDAIGAELHPRLRAEFQLLSRDVRQSQPEDRP